MQNEPSMHLCLLAHCISVPSSPPPLTHSELFIPLNDLDRLLGQLSEGQFKFCLPNAVPSEAPKTCSFTFDDGYVNNTHFLSLAEKYRLPFVLFVNSINIEQQLPFLWDANMMTSVSWRFWSDDYREAYRSLDPSTVKRLLADDNHRPFRLSELQAFSANKWAHLALHTHSHQPLVGCHIHQTATELNTNLKFLQPFPRALTRDLALPCGLYTRQTTRHLLNNKIVDRIYTIDGGKMDLNKSFVSRISLINPLMGGDLMSQIKKACSWRAKLRKQIVRICYSSLLQNRFG